MPLAYSSSFFFQNIAKKSTYLCAIIIVIKVAKITRFLLCFYMVVLLFSRQAQASANVMMSLETSKYPERPQSLSDWTAFFFVL